MEYNVEINVIAELYTDTGDVTLQYNTVTHEFSRNLGEIKMEEVRCVFVPMAYKSIEDINVKSVKLTAITPLAFKKYIRVLGL